MGGDHSVTGVQNLMNNSFFRRRMAHLEKQPFDERGHIERLAAATASGDEDNKIVLVVIERSIYLLGLNHHFRSPPSICLCQCRSRGEDLFLHPACVQPSAIPHRGGRAIPTLPEG